MIATAVGNLERLDIERGIPRIAVQVWGETMRSPHLAEDVGQIVQAVAALLSRLVERHP